MTMGVFVIMLACVLMWLLCCALLVACGLNRSAPIGERVLGGVVSVSLSLYVVFFYNLILG